MDTSREPSSRGRVRARIAGYVFLATTAAGLLAFSYRYLDGIAVNRARPFTQPLVEELTSHYGGALFFVLILLLSRRIGLAGKCWPAKLAFHATAIPVFSLCHTTWNWLSRSAIFPLVGLGEYDYGILHVRYAMELPMDITIYVLGFSFVALFDRYRAARRRELDAARLEARLARAQLQNLQAQIQPHFLFNALNTISSVMYDDVAAADRMLTRLADLLRRALHASRAQEVPLGDELELTEAYLDLMRARFGDRLEVMVDVDDEARLARVPALVLQPLVENALRHGAPPPPEPARIAVRGRREGDTVVLEVQDNGPGLEHPDVPVIGAGVGITNTVERLRGLYGEEGRLEWRSAPGAGLVVRVQLPWTTAPNTEAASGTVMAGGPALDAVTAGPARASARDAAQDPVLDPARDAATNPDPARLARG